MQKKHSVWSACFEYFNGNPRLLRLRSAQALAGMTIAKFTSVPSERPRSSQWYPSALRAWCVRRSRLLPERHWRTFVLSLRSSTKCWARSCANKFARDSRPTHLHFVQHPSARIYENKFSCISRLVGVCHWRATLVLSMPLRFWRWYPAE